MTDRYYSDRLRGPVPRTQEELSDRAWGAIVSVVQRGIALPLFAGAFPLLCEDGRGTYACNENTFRLALEGDMPDIHWPLDPQDPPDPLVALDLVEFIHEHASYPTERDYDRYWGHHHLEFNRADGKRFVRDEVNKIFARNGLVYELTEDGRVKRLLPEVVESQLRQHLALSGDDQFDELLERAVRKFTDTDPLVRREGLEHLWDAFERAKTILDSDKKRGSTAAIAAIAESKEDAEMTEGEMRALTKIGNDFRIRHHETTKVELTNGLTDYFFVRLYSLLQRLHQGITDSL